MPEFAASSDEDVPEPMPAMSFLEHLEELRKRIIYSIIAVAVGFFVCWGYAERIFALMQQPIMIALRRNGMPEKLVYLSPTEPFNLYLKIGLMAGVFVAAPFILYQVWMFISPGLYRNERSYVVPFMFSTVALFAGRRLFRLQAGLSAGARIPHRLRQTVPTDDHDRGVYRPVHDHHPGIGGSV